MSASIIYNSEEIVKSKSTDELEQELSGSADFKAFLSENSNEFVSDSIPDLLREMQKKNNISQADFATGSGMSRIYLSQIISGKRTPSRDRMIAMCLGLRCSFPDTQKLLRRAGYATLYARNKRDAMMIIALENGWKADQLNDVLYDMNEKTLF